MPQVKCLQYTFCSMKDWKSDGFVVMNNRKTATQILALLLGYIIQVKPIIKPEYLEKCEHGHTTKLQIRRNKSVIVCN